MSQGRSLLGRSYSHDRREACRNRIAGNVILSAESCSRRRLNGTFFGPVSSSPRRGLIGPIPDEGTIMRIAQVAPLYESVPPKLYGGTERVVSYLTEELVRLGHEVTLFAS